MSSARLSLSCKVLSLVRNLKKSSGGSLAVGNASSSEKRVLGEGADDDGLLISAEEFVRFVGGEYEAAEAAQGRLRKVLTLAEEKEGVTLEAAFAALDKARSRWEYKLWLSPPRQSNGHN